MSSSDITQSKFMKIVITSSIIIAALGAINWGTISLGYNVVASVFTNSKLRKIFYIIVGIAGVITLIYSIRKAMSGESEFYNQIGRYGSPQYNDYGHYGPSESGEYASLMSYYDAMD